MTVQYYKDLLDCCILSDRSARLWLGQACSDTELDAPDFADVIRYWLEIRHPGGKAQHE